MKIVPIASIIIPENRAREEFDPNYLNELMEDIALNGLQNPPVVRTEGDATLLVSGEQRYTVIRDLASAGVTICHGTQQIPLDHIPVTDFGELPPRRARVLEIHENIKRRDFTWQERVKAEAELHEILVAEAAEHGQKQTYLATAEEVAGRPLKGTTEQSYAQTEVRQAVVVAKHLDDPDVAKASNVREAVKIIQKKETEKHYAKLAEKLGTTQTHERHLLLRGKSEELMLGLPSETYDCLLTDPPYGIDAQNFGSQVFNEHKFDDSEGRWLDLMGVLATQAQRFCKPKAHAYVFCDPRHFTVLQAIFKDAGWRVFRTPLIWVKGTGMLPLPEHGPRRCYEALLYAIKGDRPTTGVYSDVLSYPPEKTTIHPDQKPVDLYIDLLRRSVRPGELVVDPFAGSGTIFVAANKLQLTATGIEEEETSYALASQRMKQAA